MSITKCRNNKKGLILHYCVGVTSCKSHIVYVLFSI
uniref:Uncharacterized protein n=1 Tax=Anguilla anguilla TaxID=7936 RepID=A0A0E9S4W6_ANGAN